MRATVEWILQSNDAEICCTAHETPSGVELAVTCAGLPLVRRVATTSVDARIEAGEIRAQWEAAGWALAGARA